MRPFDRDVPGFIMGIHIATVKTEQVTARRAVATTLVSICINSVVKTKECFGEGACTPESVQSVVSVVPQLRV